MQYPLDVTVKEEINNLAVTCPFSKAGCSWEGKFKEYESHKNICPFKTDLIPQEKSFFSISGDEQKDLTQLGVNAFFCNNIILVFTNSLCMNSLFQIAPEREKCLPFSKWVAIQMENWTHIQCKPLSKVRQTSKNFVLTLQ